MPDEVTKNSLTKWETVATYTQLEAATFNHLHAPVTTAAYPVRNKLLL